MVGNASIVAAFVLACVKHKPTIRLLLLMVVTVTTLPMVSACVLRAMLERVL